MLCRVRTCRKHKGLITNEHPKIAFCKNSNNKDITALAKAHKVVRHRSLIQTRRDPRTLCSPITFPRARIIKIQHRTLDLGHVSIPLRHTCQPQDFLLLMLCRVRTCRKHKGLITNEHPKIAFCKNSNNKDITALAKAHKVVRHRSLIQTRRDPRTLCSPITFPRARIIKIQHRTLDLGHVSIPLRHTCQPQDFLLLLLESTLHG